MKKNLTLFLCLFLVFLFNRNFYAASDYPGKALNKKGTNLLLITIDTLRADRLSCYGSIHLKTPNIDALAARGTIFKRAFAHTSTTLPSHANILLGTTPLYHGVHDNFNFIIREEMVTLAEYLAEQGYATGAFIGAYPLDSRFGLAQGFMTYDDVLPGSPGSTAMTPTYLMIPRSPLNLALPKLLITVKSHMLIRKWGDCLNIWRVGTWWKIPQLFLPEIMVNPWVITGKKPMLFLPIIPLYGFL